MCVCFLISVVEDDEDDFPTTRSDGEFLHNNNGSKEKRECEHNLISAYVKIQQVSRSMNSQIQLEETVLGRRYNYNL